MTALFFNAGGASLAAVNRTRSDRLFPGGPNHDGPFSRRLLPVSLWAIMKKIYPTMKMRLIFPALPALLLWMGCSSPPREKPDSLKGEIPVMLWKKNQIRVADDANVWSGFRRNNGDWVADGAVSTFSFFLKQAPVDGDFFVEYRKKSPGSVRVRVNNQFRFFLESSSVFRKIRRPLGTLRRGINFISFTGKKDDLVIRTLSVGRETAEDQSRLYPNEGFQLALPAGEVRMRFSGRFTLDLQLLFFDRQGNASGRRQETLSQRFPFGSKEFTLRSPVPFLLKAKCREGSARVSPVQHFPERSDKYSAQGYVFPSAQGKKIRNIFIVVVDGCQARHLALYGYGRNTGDSISRFARDSIVFRNAYANATFTAASVASMLAGEGPDQIGFVFLDNEARLKKISDDLLLLPEFLKKQGYSTSIFSPNPNLIPFFGFAQGVDQFNVMYGTWIKNESGRLVEAFSDWVSQHRSPRFSYLHIMEPHFPIIPPPPFTNQYKKRIRPVAQTVIRNLDKYKTFTGEEIQDVVDDYDSAINYADSLFGHAIDLLKQKDLYRDSLIIFTSDHGQALFEHGVWGHGWNAYEETSRIPLVIKFPDSFQWKGENRDVVQLSDLFPTIYELLVRRQGPFPSTGLVGILEGREKGDDRLAMITTFASEATYGVRWKKWYYLLSLNTLEERLYDLEGNRLESVLAIHRDVAQFLQGRLLSRLRAQQRQAASSVTVETKSLSREEYNRLKSLGYI
jgi:choline-sulfatase